MLKYIISFFILINVVSVFSQKEKDTITTSTYGMKIGIDLSKQIRMLTESDYKGLVVVGDYRLLDKLFLTFEIGTEEKLIENEVLNFNTKGSFIKIGANYNVFNNFENLENEIYVGFRISSSKFDHQLNSFTIYSKDQYWNQNKITNTEFFKDLSATWFELIFGFNAEVFNNTYMGLSLRLKRLLSQKEPTNFRNLYVPGFNKVLENNKVGVGLTYTVQFQIPIYKKKKIKI
ncbi:MAG: hypothetical protein CMD29_06840 [Flavobacteriales bacterium]|nr:hypothetical protein [Flavobacteriales bacterium]